MSSSPVSSEWWRGAVIYQVYPRSYMDSNGDGIGDLPGIEQRIPYIASLGVDAIWISPFFKSPMKDFGYDVSDYRDVDPIFGTLDDFKKLLDTAHKHDLKVLIDEVWSHTSDTHPWFHESRSNKGNAKHDWYVWADPKPDGTAPNNWLSYFGGPAWTWDSRREQYYLHHFLSAQPALNLWNPDVRKEIFDVAKFWLDMGVDGFRLDAIHTYYYDPDLKDNPTLLPTDPVPSDMPRSNPMSYQRRVNSMKVQDVIPTIEELRQFVNQWEGRCLLGEVGGEDGEATAASYVQTGKRLHLAYSFGLLGSRMTYDDILTTVRRVEDKIGDGWICWATSNHDTVRSLSRIHTPEGFESEAARLVMALGLSLRGSYCLYQGEELGLPQAKLAYEDLRDPYDIALYPDHAGRDGARTPMPWDKVLPHGGFTSAPSPWIKFWPEHSALAVSEQHANPLSTLNAYRAFLSARKSIPALTLGSLSIEETPQPVVAWTRQHLDQRILCIFNLSHDKAQWTLPADKSYALHPELPVSAHLDLTLNLVDLPPYGFAFYTY